MHSQENYFLLFGSKKLSLHELESLLPNKLSLIFEKRSSDYIGDYSLFNGHIPTRVTIEENDPFGSGEHKKMNFSDFSVIVQFSYVDGKNQEKIRHKENLKAILKEKVPDLILLRETSLLELDGKFVEEREVFVYRG